MYLCPSVFEIILVSYHANWITELQESLPMKEGFNSNCWFLPELKVVFSILFTVDLQVIKLIYSLWMKGNSSSSKELDSVWNTIMCLQLPSPCYFLLWDQHHYTIFKQHFMKHMVILKDELEFKCSSYSKEKCLFTKYNRSLYLHFSPFVLPRFKSELDSCRENRTVDHCCILLCPSS